MDILFKPKLALDREGTIPMTGHRRGACHRHLFASYTETVESSTGGRTGWSASFPILTSSMHLENLRRRIDSKVLFDTRRVRCNNRFVATRGLD